MLLFFKKKEEEISISNEGNIREELEEEKNPDQT